MVTLPGRKARTDAARWLLIGYIVLTILGTFLHIATRIAKTAPIDKVYVTLMPAIGLAALYALQKLPSSLEGAMSFFAWVTMVCLSGLLFYMLHTHNEYVLNLFLFHIGIFSLGLVLGFRPAVYYAIATSTVILILGIAYRLPPGHIVAPIFLAFALVLPSKVIEQLIEQSNAELAEINFRLEELVEARTAELRAEIAERQRAQEVLSERTAELERRNEELDAYAHTVAHDLKAPLSSVIGFSELLDKRHDKIPADKLAYYCSIIAQNGRKIVNIVDALLLLASVRKVDEVPAERLNIPEIIDDIQRRLADAILESEAEIVVPDRWPEVMSYQPWVEEILVNYISNAIKYGGRPPRVEVGATNHNGGYVRFWVRDNGRGLTQAEQARLFTPFTRLDQVRVKGYGLGLSIVQRIAEKLGGEVGVESEVGQGSTFYFDLPLTNSES